MFSQSLDFSQTSNSDYNFLHNSQNSSQTDIDGILNKNVNIIGAGDLSIINEENPISPMKINFNDNSKKSTINIQNTCNSSQYSFGVDILKGESSNTKNNELKRPKKSLNTACNKENVNNNIGQNKSNDNSNNIFQINLDTYKCKLSQQIDQVEKIASQSMNNSSSPIFSMKDEKTNNNLNTFINSSISEQEVLEHQRFNQYCSDLIDNAMNKNLEYIDNIKNNFVNSLDSYRNKFKSNAEIIKKLILLYSDDIFQKEKNKIIIANLTDKLLSHINSFFQEINKFQNFPLNSTTINNDNNASENS